MQTLYIPTLQDNPYDYLFTLWQNATSLHEDICLDFSRCGFLKQDSIVFIGGLIRLLQNRGVEVKVNLEGIRSSVKRTLEQNGFLAAFGLGDKGPDGNSVPYREDLQENKDGIVNYLKSRWLGHDWVHISEMLGDSIISKVWEIYANAFQHGNSAIGVYTCGQHFPALKILYLSIIDFGVGIPSNVRLFLKEPGKSAKESIEWAMVEGNSTKSQLAGPGGVGLGLLKEFVKLNQGSLEIFSHDGYVFIDNSKETYDTRETFFEGTLVTIKLQCDEKFYVLSSEIEDKEPMF